MARHKSSKLAEDKPKKRKRDLNEDENTSKKNQRRRRHSKPSDTDERPQDTIVSHATNASQTALTPSHGETGWTISKPMGGRILDIDPILTADEQHLILTYNTSLQVFSTVDSLLVRRIPVCVLNASASRRSSPASIVATRISTCNPRFVWVVCSDGQVYHVDWTCNAQVSPRFRTLSGSAKAMVVVPSIAQGENCDGIIMVELRGQHHIDIVAYPVNAGSGSEPKPIFTNPKPKSGIELLEASSDGQLLVGALGNRLFLGVASHAAPSELLKSQYDFYSFEVGEVISALDMRVQERPLSTVVNKKKGQSAPHTVIDVVAGGSNGSIFVYRDLLSRLENAGKPQFVKAAIHAQKLHWHQKAVHALKWSRDGNYLISGGSENALVIWQMDTSKPGFLPHLSGSVENIVVSSSGSSYAVHLDDNSAMILSTAEMKPTTYVSGIQSAVTDISRPKDLLVKRVWTVADSVQRPIPAAIKPCDPSKLHVCVGNGRQAAMTGDLSAPMLQTFDLENFTSVSRQALARTQTTYANTTSKGFAIAEPVVSHIAFSANGQWLASVDEWRPPIRDGTNVGGEFRHLAMSERCEVYLKFWQVGPDDGSLALVSRVNAPHSTSCPEAVLGLAADRSSTCFATLGADATVRLWRPRGQSHAADAGRNASVEGTTISWICSHATVVGNDAGNGTETDLAEAETQHTHEGAIAFSEDGSAVFAAFGFGEVGAVYVIDTASGRVVKTLEGLWEGRLHSIQCLSCYIVVLSDNLCVYDVVGDELRYGVVVPKAQGAHELLHLAVDDCSGHFAVALPIAGVSCIGIFDPEESEPLLVRTIPHRIVSLLSAPDASGFLALDDAAQVWVLSKESDGASLMMARSLQDLQLDGPVEKSETAAILPTNDSIMATGDEANEDEAGYMDEDNESDEQDGIDEDGDVDMLNDDCCPSIVRQHHLAAIFDASPAFAAPSVEDLFYKVTDLLATKPLSA
ncbi:hypothetical protein CDD81_4411 [Ophiocordyceps australis]|uniref:Uncharacterized protein n=1 Tax=Ophiocordyceps australis TaxID=1399860 RepID=A0A2C5YH31_9HYPO|nr:hypothetical protein CDD81_4411 [Ophiocordyceps australis]